LMLSSSVAETAWASVIWERTALPETPSDSRVSGIS
jgi:hypothetical protein